MAIGDSYVIGLAPIYYWKCDETSGTRLADTINGAGIADLIGNASLTSEDTSPVLPIKSSYETYYSGILGNPVPTVQISRKIDHTKNAAVYGNNTNISIDMLGAGKGATIMFFYEEAYPLNINVDNVGTFAHYASIIDIKDSSGAYGFRIQSRTNPSSEDSYRCFRIRGYRQGDNGSNDAYGSYYLPVGGTRLINGGYYIVITCDSTNFNTLTMWVNGVKVNSHLRGPYLTEPAATSNTTPPFSVVTLGKSFLGTWDLSGYDSSVNIGQVALFDRVLTDLEISDYYAARQVQSLPAHVMATGASYFSEMDEQYIGPTTSIGQGRMTHNYNSAVDPDPRVKLDYMRFNHLGITGTYIDNFTSYATNKTSDAPSLNIIANNNTATIFFVGRIDKYYDMTGGTDPNQSIILKGAPNAIDYVYGFRIMALKETSSAYPESIGINIVHTTSTGSGSGLATEIFFPVANPDAVHTFAFTYTIDGAPLSDTNVQFYLDGVAVLSNKSWNNAYTYYDVAAPVDRLYLGTYGLSFVKNSEATNFCISKLTIYETALAALDIATLHNKVTEAPFIGEAGYDRVFLSTNASESNIPIDRFGYIDHSTRIHEYARQYMVLKSTRNPIGAFYDIAVKDSAGAYTNILSGRSYLEEYFSPTVNEVNYIYGSGESRGYPIESVYLQNSSALGLFFKHPSIPEYADITFFLANKDRTSGTLLTATSSKGNVNYPYTYYLVKYVSADDNISDDKITIDVYVSSASYQLFRLPYIYKTFMQPYKFEYYIDAPSNTLTDGIFITIDFNALATRLLVNGTIITSPVLGGSAGWDHYIYYPYKANMYPQTYIPIDSIVFNYDSITSTQSTLTPSIGNIFINSTFSGNPIFADELYYAHLLYTTRPWVYRINIAGNPAYYNYLSGIGTACSNIQARGCMKFNTGVLSPYIIKLGDIKALGQKIDNTRYLVANAAITGDSYTANDIDIFSGKDIIVSMVVETFSIPDWSDVETYESNLFFAGNLEQGSNIDIGIYIRIFKKVDTTAFDGYARYLQVVLGRGPHAGNVGVYTGEWKFPDTYTSDKITFHFTFMYTGNFGDFTDTYTSMYIDGTLIPVYKYTNNGILASDPRYTIDTISIGAVYNNAKISAADFAVRDVYLCTSVVTSTMAVDYYKKMSKSLFNVEHNTDLMSIADTCKTQYEWYMESLAENVQSVDTIYVEGTVVVIELLSDIATTGDSLVWTWLNKLNEALQLQTGAQDANSRVRVAILSEALKLADKFNSVGLLKHKLLSSALVTTTLRAISKNIVNEIVSVSATSDNIYKVIYKSVNNIFTNSDVYSTAVTKNLIRELQVCLSALYSNIGLKAFSAVTVNDNTDLIYKVVKTVISSLVSYDTVEKHVLLAVVAENNIIADTDYTCNTVFNTLLSDSINFYALLPAGDSVYTIVLNSVTKAVTEYTNYSFNSIDGNIAADSTGLYKIDASYTTDDGKYIASKITTGLLDLGTDKHKSINNVYLALSSTGDVLLKLVTSEKAGRKEHWYKVKSTNKELSTAKVKIGKGVKARYFQLSLENTDGSLFELDKISLLPAVLSRRV